MDADVVPHRDGTKSAAADRRAARYGRAMVRRWTIPTRLMRRGALPALALVAVALSLPGTSLAGLGGATPQPEVAPVRVSLEPVASPVDLSAAGPVATLPGTTGTVAALPEPIGIAPAGPDASIVAARPFSLAGVSAIDRGRAVQCLTAAIYYEAASEPEDGQRAVAQVVLNRVRHPAFPATVCGVVYQGSARAGCQFSFACDGAMARRVSAAAWARATRYAADALGGRVFAGVGLATHYHTYAVTPAWNRALVMTDVVGAHFFHRWKGYWGTAAAFGRAYVGGEPVPGPQTPVAPALLPLPDPLIAAAAPVSPAPSPAAAPVPMPAGAPSSGGGPAAALPASPDHLPQSAVLDRWKDVGKPLR